MTGIQWLLQSNHPDLIAIREIEKILLAQGNVVHMAPLKGRSPDMPDLSDIDSSAPVVCYGPSFVPRALRHPDLAPGIFFDPQTFRWSSFQGGWGREAMLGDGRIVSAGDVLGSVGSGHVFVRPDEDSKAFDGGVFDRDGLEALIDRALASGNLSPETCLMVADTVEVDAEWRTFVVGNEVVAASSYRRGGVGDINLHVPHPVIDLAFDAVERWSPADVFCLDIALSGSRYGIVEANCFNASRFYGADATAILSAVSEFVAAQRPIPSL
ncbi:ATP-grasp domain-containing protein [Agrobacterium rubi]|nr:ATP-grasp domain-containing protein [Agrobacterium rubi]NTF24597.1 ATP-grasp domain-containing protein [Agrobacterium rubi]